ncbi:metal transporter CNNM3 isoform X3 [Leucoraja erinacea]|uniref:metal transporter CNNM3 isoform X3 n=1 Tax=Leucoraja erinaceus TaxID=7782 RepID=UPI002454153A|nr:metal transporter CNNM3 isoform X3 [Leucoraja erinacea]
MAPGARCLWVLCALCGLELGQAASRGAQVRRGARLESGAGHVYMDGGVIKASPRASFDLRVFGPELERAVWPWLGFSRDPSCDNHSLESGWLRLVAEKQQPNSSVLVRVEAGAAGLYYLCALGNGGLWSSLGDWKTQLDIQPQPQPAAASILAVWGQILLLAVLLLSSALFNLLHLSVLWLDPLELHIIRHCGSEREKKSAKSLEPIRKRGNLVLSSLVLGSVLANSALGVLFYLAFDAILPAIFVCAALMFLICEILPYTICSRYGFAIASRTSWLTCLFIIITFPVSLPVALVLDLALRQDISTCYIREKILDMLRSSDPYREFVKEEFSRGALRTKVVEDIMTNLNDCFMLSAGAVLDFNTMSEIMQCGHTRIPVYEDEKSNIVDIVYVKDLAMVDPEDCTPLNTITKFYNHPLHFVFNDTKLDAVLEEFKKGKSHMAMVQKVNNEGDGDPFYEVMGLVTLGDVIEEIIKSEILDESDDADLKVKKKPPTVSFPIERKKEDFSFFKVPDIDLKVKISPQLLLATQRFLSREVELFNPSRVSESVLLHLLKQSSVNQEVKFNENDKLAPEHYLYQRNQPVDYFILVLQGRVEVEIGKEGLKFENGAFTYYGVSALTVPSSVHQSPATSNKWSQRDPFSRDLLESGENASLSLYCPDYTVRALNDLQVLKVTRLQYLNALMASKIQNSSPSPENFELKVMPTSQAKLLNKQNSSTCVYQFPLPD